MRPQEVAELSSLLDQAQGLAPDERERWLGELEQSKPDTARHLRSMLAQTQATDTALLPKLPALESDDAVASAGERVGPYRLIQEIGRGGMGSVWLAERADGTSKRRVALKLPRLAWAAGLGKRMARERDIGALLEHPNIARLYDAGVDEHGRPYIAMEYIDGQPIDVYGRDHALDLRAKLKLFVEVAQAVAYAHGRLVLHRDLKPANVLVDADGHVHLLDFGIAKLLDDTGAGADLTQEQGRVLTLNYASPEQIAGRPLGVTADVYALGVMLYELLTGTLPYTLKRNTTGAMEEAILAGDAPSPSSRVADKRLARELRGDIDAILTKAIKRDPNERYPTADALAADIQRYLDGHAIEARPDSTWYRLRKAVIRHKVPVLAASAVLAVALIGLTTTLIQGGRAADEAERARLTTAFVSELFWLNATQQSRMTDGTARARPAVFVDRGAQLIEQQFEKRPELKAEMYGVAGRTYADLGVDRPAIEYAKLQLETLRVQGANTQHIAKALMLLAEISHTAERYRDAEEHSRRAVESLPQGDALLPEALALLARAQVRTVKWAEARKSVDDARGLLGARQANGSPAAAWLLNVEADVASFEGKFDEAALLYEKSIEEAMAAQGPLSRAAIDMRLRRAEQLIYRLNKPQEALVHRDAAVSAMEALGGIYKLRAALAVAYLQMRLSFVGLVSYEETLSVVRGVKNRLETDASLLPPEVRAQIDFHTGWALMGSGDIAAGSALLLRSADVFEASTQNLWRHFEIFQGVGFALLYVGDHDSADKAMRRTITIREEMGRQTAAASAYPYLLVALNLTMQGRYKEAEEFLSSAPPFVGEADWFSPEEIIGYALARARLAAGNISGALQVLPRVSDPIDDNLPYSKHLRGEILCASGDPTRGLEIMLSSIAIVGRSLGQNHPELAKMRADAGLCALQIGARPRAEEMADLARRAFQAQPNVSPWFKEPLKRLEKQLGAKAI